MVKPGFVSLIFLLASVFLVDNEKIIPNKESCHNNNTIYIDSVHVMPSLSPAKCLDISTVNIKSERLKKFKILINTLIANDIGLTKFPARFLKNFPNLKHINMSMNKLSFLPGDLDQYVPNLKLINLTGNKLKVAKRRPLTKSKSLEVLILSKNKLRKLNSQLFNGLPSLRVLYLDGNFLTSLKVHPFRKLHHLEVLHLGGNQLESIPIRALNKVSERIRVIYKNNSKNLHLH
ncbi:hypothetical protein HHI36_020613 [Cryptolaemus montrouzieri]|uniref:Uncharacterized protein n=2 Tax=Cryptolaemus montrouzieri TaxID=559131 RepID=A0ABD2NB95_9CUCU